MHGVLGVVSIFIFEFSAVNVLLPLLPEQSFHLVVRESEERLHMPLCKEKLRPGRKVIPRIGCELKRREQKMQSRWIALGGEPCPLHQVYRQTSTSSGPLPPSRPPVVKTKCSSCSRPRTLVDGGM